jgi:hypothetical protein
MIASPCKGCKTEAMPHCAEECRRLRAFQTKALVENARGLKSNTESDSIHEHTLSPGVVRNKRGGSH